MFGRMMDAARDYIKANPYRERQVFYLIPRRFAKKWWIGRHTITEKSSTGMVVLGWGMGVLPTIEWERVEMKGEE